MTARVWRPGAVDSVQAPYDWTPFGAPQAGDTLVMGQGTAYLGPNPASSTVVLSGNDLVSETTQPVLVVFGHASASVVVDQLLLLGPNAIFALGTVDVFGAPTVHLSEPTDTATATINIGAYSQMRGDVTELGSSDNVDIKGSTSSGASTSTFANETSTLGRYGSLGIELNVVGAGTFALGYGTGLGFSAGVSAGQTINQTGGLLTIYDTRDFHATVNLSDIGDPEFIHLLLVADAYTFHNDLLSFFSGGKDVFDLKLNTPGVAVTFAGGYGDGVVLQDGVLITTAPPAAVAQVTLPNHA